MSNLRLFPSHHFGIGFDNIFNELERLMATSPQGKSTYPPINVEKISDTATRITMAVAGFSEADIDVTQQENILVVEGKKSEEESADTTFVYRGIAKRNFKQEFVLADHVEVKTASLKDGMLVIDLEQQIPDQLQPKKIPLIKE